MPENFYPCGYLNLYWTIDERYSLCLKQSKGFKEENTIIDTVQAGLSAVNEATNPTVNALETLKVITKESAEFLRLVGPVGAFISVAAKTYFQVNLSFIFIYKALIYSLNLPNSKLSSYFMSSQTRITKNWIWP